MVIRTISDRYVFEGFKKKTNAEFFKDLKKGDILRFMYDIKNIGGASGGYSYAPVINITCIKSCDRIYIYKITQNKLSNILNSLKLRKVIY
jgi:hypothetical protein